MNIDPLEATWEALRLSGERLRAGLLSSSGVFSEMMTQREHILTFSSSSLTESRAQQLCAFFPHRAGPWKELFKVWLESSLPRGYFPPHLLLQPGLQILPLLMQPSEGFRLFGLKRLKACWSIS